MWKFIENNSLVLAHELHELFAESQQVSIATAFVRLSGVHLLLDDIARLVARGGEIRLLFGTDFAISEAQAIRELLRLGVRVKHYRGSEMFHPKAYVFKSPRRTIAIIGSSNISGSALTVGREWSLLIDSTLCDRRPVEVEFERLWHSGLSGEPTEALLSALEQARTDTRAIDLAKEDRVPPQPGFAGTRPEYKVTQTSQNHRHHWWFNLASNKVAALAAAGEFNVVVVCDAGSPREHVFSIPYSYLRDNVFPSVRPGADGRYMFEVAKDSFEFSFRGPVRFDGKSFLRHGRSPR